MQLKFSMREALDEPEIFGNIIAGETWAAWRALLIAARGEPLTPEELEVFQELSQRKDPPTQPCKELWAIVGRRGGKTQAISVLASYIAVCRDYESRLAPGQRAELPIVAAIKKQALQALNYITGIFQTSPYLQGMIEGDPLQYTLRLTNRVDINVMAASFRTLRSATNIAVIADEIALWRGENAANPDKEILRALRPGGATLGAPLFVLSSPYAKRGELWDTYKRDFGPEGDPRILVVKAPSLRMNSLPEVVEEYELEMRRDPANAKAEYGAEFRDTVSDFIDPDTVAACVDVGVTSRPYDANLRYSAFMDASGGGVGSNKDAMTLAIAHRVGHGEAVLDHLEIVEPPVVPDVACIRFAEVLKRYHLYSVTGDAYAGAWPETLLSRQGIGFEKTGQAKSQIYVDFLALLNSRMVRLLDHPVMLKQLLDLERVAKQGGRDTVDHPSGGHDDAINSAAGALLKAAFRKLSLCEML